MPALCWAENPDKAMEAGDLHNLGRGGSSTQRFCRGPLCAPSGSPPKAQLLLPWRLCQGTPCWARLALESLSTCPGRSTHRPHPSPRPSDGHAGVRPRG